MKIPRFDYEGRPNAPRPLRWEKRPHPKWTRIDHPFIRDSVSSARRRIFAIVAQPKIDVGGKVIRRILIYDNHPDSLRLVLNSGVDADSDDTSRRERRTSIICGFILIAMLIAAVLWPLCW